MAMSRKHYTEVAGIIKTQVVLTDELAIPERDIVFPVLDRMARDLANAFKRDNSAFDRARFLEACGLGD